MFSVPYIVWVHTDWLDNEKTGKGVKGSSPCGFRGVYGLTAAITGPYPAESTDVRHLYLMCTVQVAACATGRSLVQRSPNCVWSRDIAIRCLGPNRAVAPMKESNLGVITSPGVIFTLRNLEISRKISFLTAMLWAKIWTRDRPKTSINSSYPLIQFGKFHFLSTLPCTFNTSARDPSSWGTKNSQKSGKRGGDSNQKEQNHNRYSDVSTKSKVRVTWKLR